MGSEMCIRDRVYEFENREELEGDKEYTEVSEDNSYRASQA